MSPRAGYSSEARAPKSIIPEGKKGSRSLMSIFTEIQPVTGFSGKILARRDRRVPRYNCRNKVTGEMRVRAESRPIPPENVKAQLNRVRDRRRDHVGEWITK
jgi:hypothetical protein